MMKLILSLMLVLSGVEHAVAGAEHSCSRDDCHDSQEELSTSLNLLQTKMAIGHAPLKKSKRRTKHVSDGEPVEEEEEFSLAEQFSVSNLTLGGPRCPPEEEFCCGGGDTAHHTSAYEAGFDQGYKDAEKEWEESDDDDDE
eukprot:gnl/TRDRNA2_/TRDRNA2_150864_c1_seq3.p1 gnl/TRDRNA2_/TRDRNA2_150864_c1~~gnl/TRDRNA2_/TRDRNA2_150864_c1_seq3.p1  ORF type:complete len:141 (-),score=40.80 gnl/TRDRNA2_/TRDRNA2_150864_c1_seq3:260-682(-)